jgi:8-oxo-dGTP diphosphatase
LNRTQIHVMAGAILDGQGRVLVTRRPDHVHQGGLWEFPGGKLEPGETPEQGLARELREELGIAVLASRPLIRIHHDYGDRHILLDVRRVEAHAGVPRGREGQPLAWLEPESTDPARFPAADRPIITALRLPQRLLITGPDPRDPEALLSRLRAALQGGVRLVQLRAHALTDLAYLELAAGAYAICTAAGARLLLNRDPAVVADSPRHGLHLGARALMALDRRPGRPGELIGASCHGPAELVRAAALGLDYALLSPVKATATHPGARPLGWERFAAWVDPIPLPVFALGGLTPADLPEAIRHGAQGIAAIRGLWPA